MGRKSQSKQSSKKNGGKENNKFLQQKRKELVILVDKLLKLTSIFQATSPVAKSWEHHLEIEAILQEVRNIEAPVYNAKQNARQACLEKYVMWLNDNGAKFAGINLKILKTVLMDCNNVLAQSYLIVAF